MAHYLYFVQIKDEDVTTSQIARQEADEALATNNFASDNQGYFGSSKADWYVIGKAFWDDIKLLESWIDEVAKDFN